MPRVKYWAVIPAALIVAGLLMAFIPVERPEQYLVTRTETVTSMTVRTRTLTSLFATYAPIYTVPHWGGELPSAVSELFFLINNNSLIIHIEVEREEGLKYPYTYGVFLSDNPLTGLYCAVINPWLIRTPEAFLLEVEGAPFDEVLPSDVSIYPRKNLTVFFGKREVKTAIPLPDLDKLTHGSQPAMFYTWVHVWALGNERYLFDFIGPTKISFEPIEHTRTLRAVTLETEQRTIISRYRIATTTLHREARWESTLITPILIAAAALILYRHRREMRRPT